MTADFWVMKKTVGINKKRAGKVETRLVIELKDQKYRFYFTDLEFRRYLQDSRTQRHYLSKKKLPLESEKKGTAKKELQSIINKSYIKVEDLASELKRFMRYIPQEEETNEVDLDKDW